MFTQEFDAKGQRKVLKFTSSFNACYFFGAIILFVKSKKMNKNISIPQPTLGKPLNNNI